MSDTGLSSNTAGKATAVAVAHRPLGVRLGVEIALLTGFFMLLGTFYTGGTGTLKTAGKYAVIVVLLLILYSGIPYLVRRGMFDPRLKPAAWWFTAFAGLSAVLLVLGPSARGATVTSHLIIYAVFFALLCSIRWTPLATTVLSWPFGLFFMFSGLLWLASGMPMYFRGLMANPNTLGAVAGFLLFFPLLALHTVKTAVMRYAWWLVAAAGVVMVIVSGARSIWLALLAALCAWWLWPWACRTKLRFNLTIAGLLGFAVIFTVAYALVSLLVPIGTLNEITGGVTGEGLFSGREILWLGLMSKIAESPLLGYGPGVVPGDFLPTDLSAHNSYLTVTMQLGLLGLSAYLMLLSSIWRLFWHGRLDGRVRLAAAFFVAILVHQVFELVFIQDKIAFNLSQWLIVGIGVGTSLNWAGNGNGVAQPER